MRRLPIIIGFSLFTTVISAQDRHFVRTYESTNLAKGTRDLELWSTIRTGKDAYFRAIDERVEFEVGLTNRLQTAFYLNGSTSSFIDKNDSTATMQHTTDFSLSSEWKFKISDANTDVIGSGLYGEFTLSDKELELETKILLDKRINNHLLALNLVAEFEWEQSTEAKVVNGEVKQESDMELEATPMEIDLAYMYNVRPNFGVGLEAKQHFEVTTEGGLEHSALLAGPTVYWTPKDSKHSFIFSFMPQLTNMNKTAAQPNALDLDEYEKYDFRLLIDFSF